MTRCKEQLWAQKPREFEEMSNARRLPRPPTVMVGDGKRAMVPSGSTSAEPEKETSTNWEAVPTTTRPVLPSDDPLVVTVVTDTSLSKRRREKAPPINKFSAEDPNLRFNDWLPSLVRVAEWNS